MEGDEIESHLNAMEKIFDCLNSLTNPEHPLT
jgi:hypothetical protein